jgi:hypothetical protein
MFLRLLQLWGGSRSLMAAGNAENAAAVWPSFWRGLFIFSIFYGYGFVRFGDARK